MGATLEFDGANVRAVLKGLVARQEPARLQVTLRGPVVALAERAVIRVAEGRAHLIRTADRSGVDALVRILLADAGSVQALPDSPPATVQGIQAFESLYGQAERQARQLLEPLEPLGGLGAVLRTDLGDMVVEHQNMPDAANKVMSLADGQRSVAEILAESTYSELLTARIIGKLFGMGALMDASGAVTNDVLTADLDLDLTETPSLWEMPASGWGDTAEVPGEDDMEVAGPDVSDDVAQWLSTGDAPPPLMSDAAFAQAFVTAEMPAVEAPKRAGSRSSSTANASPSQETSTAVELPAATAQRRSVLPWIGATVTVAVLAGAVAVIGGVGPFAESEGGALAAADTRSATKVKTSPPAPPGPFETSPEPSLEPEAGLGGPAPDALRRTIAAPDAVADLKEAEALWETGQYADAETVLERLRAAHSEEAAVFVLSGQVFLDVGKLRRANAMANRALELDRRSFRAWVLKASVLQFEQHPRRALAAYRRALQLGPNHEMSAEIQAVVEQLERTTGQ